MCVCVYVCMYIYIYKHIQTRLELDPSDTHLPSSGQTAKPSSVCARSEWRRSFEFEGHGEKTNSATAAVTDSRVVAGCCKFFEFLFSLSLEIVCLN